MTNNIDTAIARLQALALACTSVTIKSAPTYPVENAEPAPFAIAHVVGGEILSGDATFGNMFTDVAVNIFFSRAGGMIQAYQQIDLLHKEYCARLIGDPTLAGSVQTIVFPIPFIVESKAWNKVPYEILTFTTRVKTNITAQATA